LELDGDAELRNEREGIQRGEAGGELNTLAAGR
jgi:hypothetical protein